MAIYERHQPEKLILYQTVARAWPKISLEYAVDGESIPGRLEGSLSQKGVSRNQGFTVTD